MDLTKHVPFGRTGLMVSRIGLASGYGVPQASIEKAFHEHGVNYFWLSFLKRGNMLRAIRNLPRDELVIKLPWPAFISGLATGSVDRWLRKLGTDHVDLVVIQGVDKPPPPRIIDLMSTLRDSGKVRFVGISSHNRPLVGRILRGELEVPADFFQIRYNAVHTGAEQDIFPHLPSENRPGIEVFTATCWGKLLKPRLLPPDEKPLAPADCYRFVLSHPDVHVCHTGPSSAAQLDQNIEALAKGPLDDDEMARIRRIGKHIYGK